MNPFAPRTYGTLERVTDRVYLLRHVVNSVIVVGDRALAVIDTQVNDTMAKRLWQHARALANTPLRYAINTHYHWDHTAGNHVFKRAGATVVSSTHTKVLMQTRSARQQAFLASRGFELGPTPYLADETFAAEREIDLGNQRLHLLHLGSAETDDAVAIHLPQEGCVIAGDTVMTGSFPIFGQPVMNEGLMGTSAWLETMASIESLRPTHILPGHGPVAHEQELALLKRVERYFLDEVAARVERQMPLPALLAELESQLPAWMTAIPAVWGTPRYAILRVYRGLVADAEPGWQHYKPSAIPTPDEARVQAMCATLAELPGFQAAMSECAEGGDVGSAIAVARHATRCFPQMPAAWVLLAECLMRSAGCVASVLEKGDFFVEAQRTLRHAMELEPCHAPAHLALGRFVVMRAYRNGGNPAPGMAHLRQAIDYTPVPADPRMAGLLAEAHFYLGMGYRTQGHEAQARACFQTALAQLPAFQPALLALMGAGGDEARGRGGEGAREEIWRCDLISWLF